MQPNLTATCISQQNQMVLSIAIYHYLIRYQSFAYTQLNYQTDLFQLGISYLFALSLNIKQLTYR